MGRRRFSRLVGAVLVSCYLIAAGPSNADASTVDLLLPPADTLLGSDTIVLPRIEITVLRSTTSTETAPLAVAALEGERMREGRSGVFIEEALQGLPGVQVQNRFNPAVGERIAIRGFGARAQFGMRGIRVVVDGVPSSMPDGQANLEHLDLGSIGRVEVIRGPASALFGNASGGVLSFQSRPPAPGAFEGEVEQSLGSHGLTRTQATASGTLDGTGYLLTASRGGWEGFRSNPEAEGQTYGSAERLGLNARVTRTLLGGELSMVANALDLDAENPGSVDEARLAEPDRPVVAFPYLAHRTRKELGQVQGGIRWAGPLSDVLRADVSVFGIRRNVVNPIPFNYIDLERGAGGVRSQLSSMRGTALGDLQWHVGVEYERQEDDRTEYSNQMGEPGDLHTSQLETVRTAGLFLQADLPLPRGIRGLAGLRYDHVDLRADDRIDRTEEGFSGTGKRTMDQLSPSIGLNVPLGLSTNLFGSVGSVFTTPSTTELKNRPGQAGGFNPQLEPQRGVSGEVGVRTRLGTGASMEITTYRTQLRDELIPFEIEEVEGQVFYRNVGESRHTGLEATFTAASAGGLVRGDFTYSWLNARFVHFELDGEDLGGNRVPGVAPHRAQAALRLSPEAYFAALEAQYVHAVPANDQNTASAPSYLLLDLRAGLREHHLAGATFSPWAAVTNLLDRDYTASIAVNAAGARYYEPGPGRSFQAGIRATF